MHEAEKHNTSVEFFNAKDVLQFNATIIAGVMIFLTLAASLDPSVRRDAEPTIVFAIVPFITSSFLIIFGGISRAKLFDKNNRRQKIVEYGYYATYVGLLYLAYAVIRFVYGF